VTFTGQGFPLPHSLFSSFLRSSLSSSLSSNLYKKGPTLIWEIGLSPRANYFPYQIYTLRLHDILWKSTLYTYPRKNIRSGSDMNIISAQIFSARSVGRTIHSRSLFYFHKVLAISRNIESIFLTIWKEIAVQLNFSHLKERFNRFQNIFTDFLCRSWYKRIIMHSAILDSIPSSDMRDVTTTVTLLSIVSNFHGILIVHPIFYYCLL
jgi:hypothetical protein